jgi:formyltetrahydrofolate deformylase
MSRPDFVITLSCEDRPGIVAAVTTELAAIGANIAESNQFWDRQSNRFFMRIAVAMPEGTDAAALRKALKAPAARFDMRLEVNDFSVRPKIIIMVSKFDHAMLHLIYQIRVGWLDAEVVAIVSNHEDSRRTAEIEGIPFHHLPMAKDRKAEQEEKLLTLVAETGADLVILARYMQVLSDRVSQRLYGKVINIHHSFLPSFKGAKPYGQAHERGVKLIGATAHYVTAALDEGPIIEQDVERVDHSMDVNTLTGIGRDVENVVLARAVKWHAEHRILLNGGKTVVFR